MHQQVFECIKNEVVEFGPFFCEGKKCIGKMSCSIKEKLVAAVL